MNYKKILITCTTLVFYFVFLGSLSIAFAQIPPDLQDNGECEIDSSQKSTVETKEAKFELISWFQPGERIAAGQITKKDIDELAKEVARLKASPCYKVCVRSFVTHKGVKQAFENCDFVYVVGHGVIEKNSYYIDFEGKKNPNTKIPEIKSAKSVWIGACYGEEIIKRLNVEGEKRYRTLSEFDKDGTALRSSIIQSLTAELKKLNVVECKDRIKVCILAGQQAVKRTPK